MLFRETNHYLNKPLILRGLFFKNRTAILLWLNQRERERERDPNISIFIFTHAVPWFVKIFY